MRLARALGPKYEVRRLVGQGGFAEVYELGDLDLDPLRAGFRVVISGHSHQPVVDDRGGVLYLNPGSAGPRRFNLPVSVARLKVSGGRAEAEIVGLQLM